MQRRFLGPKPFLQKRFHGPPAHLLQRHDWRTVVVQPVHLGSRRRLQRHRHVVDKVRGHSAHIPLTLLHALPPFVVNLRILVHGTSKRSLHGAVVYREERGNPASRRKVFKVWTVHGHLANGNVYCLHYIMCPPLLLVTADFPAAFHLHHRRELRQNRCLLLRHCIHDCQTS